MPQNITTTSFIFNSFMLQKKNEPLELDNVNVLHSFLLILTSGKITLSSNEKVLLSKSGPVLLFIAKNQIFNLKIESEENGIEFRAIDLNSQKVKNVYNIFTHNGIKTLTKKSNSRILSAEIQPGVEEVFYSLQTIMKDSKEKKCVFKNGCLHDTTDYPLMFLLSTFLGNPESLSLFREVSINSLHEQIYSIILKDIGKQWSLKNIADELFMSQSTVKRKLAQEKTTFSNIYLNARMHHAIRLLRTGEYNVTQTSQLCGYESTSYFTSTFKRHFNITPSEFFYSAAKQC